MVARKSFHQAKRGTKSFPDKQRFFAAAQYNHVGTLKEFLAEDAEALTWTKDGKTALVIACEEGHHLAVQLLLENGAAADGRQGPGGTRPLHAAVRKNATSVIGMLLHRRACVDATRDGRVTPLMDAVSKKNVEAATTLLRAGASVSRKDDQGRAPLHFAAEHDCPEAAALLIDQGAALNAQDARGFTPLMDAAAAGGLEAARLLLERGADHRLKNAQGQTARDIALARRDSEPSFTQIFLSLIDARNEEEAAQIGARISGGATRDVKVGKPLRFRRRQAGPGP